LKKAGGNIFSKCGALSGGLHAQLSQEDIEKRVNLTEQIQDTKK
jgi:hypothetical protein